jgi:RNA polymerase sigma factor (sigma-70 family)
MQKIIQKMNVVDFRCLPDEELISLISLDGNSDLFQILYKRYYSKVVDKCYTLLKNKQFAKESAQDILSKVYEKLDSFKGLSSFSSWLYSITYNYCIDYLRSYKKLHYPDWNIRNELTEIIDETEEDINSLIYDRLMQTMEILHPEEKAMLIMKYNDDLSMKQIAEAMRITESAAKMRIKRAKARLLFNYRKMYSDFDK